MLCIALLLIVIPAIVPSVMSSPSCKGVKFNSPVVIEFAVILSPSIVPSETKAFTFNVPDVMSDAFKVPLMVAF